MLDTRKKLEKLGKVFSPSLPHYNTMLVRIASFLLARCHFSQRGKKTKVACACMQRYFQKLFIPFQLSFILYVCSCVKIVPQHAPTLHNVLVITKYIRTGKNCAMESLKVSRLVLFIFVLLKKCIECTLLSFSNKLVLQRTKCKTTTIKMFINNFRIEWKVKSAHLQSTADPCEIKCVNALCLRTTWYSFYATFSVSLFIAASQHLYHWHLYCSCF